MLTLEYGALITVHQLVLFLIEDILAESSVPGTVNTHCFHQPFILKHRVTKTKGHLFKSWDFNTLLLYECDYRFMYFHLGSIPLA